MPELANLTPIQAAWISFAESVQGLLVAQPDDRPLDQYVEFRNQVMKLVRSDEFVTALIIPVRTGATASLTSIDDALLAELRAFPRAVGIAGDLETAPERPRWFKRLLGRAGTVAGSVKDLLENAPPLVKNGLTLFKELVALFKGSSEE